MCEKCDYSKAECCIYIEPLTKEYYFKHRTDEWDNTDKCFVHERIYISYCPWCGRPLSDNKI